VRRAFLCGSDELSGQNFEDSKVIDRSHVESFGFQVIGQGGYVAAHGELVFFRMPGLGELEGEHYEWARSAPVL
jgi:hypothetical protein